MLIKNIVFPETLCKIGLIICIPLTNRASPILRFQAGSAITMECICVHKYIYSDFIFYRCILHKLWKIGRLTKMSVRFNEAFLSYYPKPNKDKNIPNTKILKGFWDTTKTN